MKTIHFKVNSVFTKKDVERMQKQAARKTNLRILIIIAVVIVAYVVTALFGAWLAEEPFTPSIFIPDGIFDAVLIAALLVAVAFAVISPYYKARKMIKDAPGGEIKAILYFYDRTFRYGWGNSFSTIAYVDIQEFRVLDDAFYIRADDLSYWVKKADFEMGKAEDFQKFIESKRKVG